MEEKSKNLLDQLAAATPTPGGGSAAAHTAAVSAALVAMVARLTIGKKKYENIQLDMSRVIELADQYRNELEDYVIIDADAFNQFMSARRMPQNSGQEKAARDKAIEEATLHAAQVPLQVARITLAVMTEAVQLAEKANINAIADAASASLLAHAAIKAAGNNVRINLLGLGRNPATESKHTEIDEILDQAKKLAERVDLALHERGGI